MEIFRNTRLKIKFEALSLPEFWSCMTDERLELSQLAAKLLLLSGTSYLSNDSN
jgi:hypothetical protein